MNDFSHLALSAPTEVVDGGRGWMNGYVDGRESGAAAGEGCGCMLDGGAWIEERGLSEQGGTDQPALSAPSTPATMQCRTRV